MREDSLMIMLSANEADIKDPTIVINHLKAGNDLGVSLEDMHFDDERGVVMKVKVGEKPYEVCFYPTEATIPPYVRQSHQFSDKEIKVLQNVRAGLAVVITFDDDYLQCYQDQLKIVCVMLPDVIAVLDCPSEKLLSGKWIRLAASSSVLPSPRYLFTVQAVYTDDEVWLHTHGMRRCEMNELEIMCSEKEKYDNHYHIIETMAFRMLESKEPINPGDPVFLAQMGEDQYMVSTAVPWKEALSYYPEATIGTAEDRDEWHDNQTCVVMLYLNPKDEEERKYTKVQYFDEQLMQNPMFYFSHSETDRMRRLAGERIAYLRQAMDAKMGTVIAKIGLKMDREFWNEDDPATQKEHIWFEIKEITDDTITGELTQEPYYVKAAKPGDVMTFPHSDITDWMIITPDVRITPDDAYLLDRENTTKNTEPKKKPNKDPNKDSKNKKFFGLF